MGKEKYKWYKIGELGEQVVEENSISIIEVNSKKISVARWHGNLYGFAYKCPHAGGILADGSMDQSGNIICPLHRYKYSIQNGYNVSGEGYYLNTYPIELKSDGIYIGIKDTSIWNFFKD
jgi:nitrite reductase/ring-hydroxylating ferredoxin subunit